MARDNTRMLGGRLKGPSLRRTAVVYTSRGRLIMSKWPRSRPTRSQKSKDLENRFAVANRLWRYTDAEIQIPLIEGTKGTPYYPRDFFLSSVYGRLFAITDVTTGRTAYPMAAKQDVSASLDVLAQLTGEILARGPKGWGPVASGALGQVLTANGPDAAPSFQDSGGGGGGGGVFYGQAFDGNLGGSAHAGRGNWAKLVRALKVSRIMGNFQALSGSTYAGWAGSMTDAGIITSISKSEPITINTNVRASYWFDFAAPVEVAAGLNLFFIITRTDGDDDYVLPLSAASGDDFGNLPSGAVDAARIAKANPAIDDQIEVGFSTSFFGVGVTFSL